MLHQVIITCIILGILLGILVGYLIYIYKSRKLRKEAEKEFKKDDPIDGELKPCWICGLKTTGDVCSLEHQQQWVKNHTRLSEGNYKPNKVGELNKGSSNELAPTP